MKAEDVPQDRNPLLSGERKLSYAVDREGRYVGVASDGWEVERIVTGLAIDDFERRAQAALERARAGRSSPLEVHMYARHMDWQLLAQTSGRPRWLVRLHARPALFRRLGARTLRRYADVLGLDVDALRALPDR